MTTSTSDMGEPIRDGKFWLIPTPNGLRRVYVVAGGADDQDDDPDDDSDDDDDDDDAQKPKPKFTQAQLDKLVGRARTKAKSAAVNDLVKELGLGSVEELKAAITKKADDKGGDTDAKVTELTGKLATAEQRAATAEANLAQFILTSKVKDALIAAGLNPKAAVRSAKLVEVDEDADDDDISTAVETLKEEMPHLFPTSGDDEDDNQGPPRRKSSSPPNSNPGGAPKGSGKRSKDPRATARSLLHERHPQTSRQN